MKTALLAVAVVQIASSGLWASPAAFHRLGVYSLATYQATQYYVDGSYVYDNWKTSIEPMYSSDDPYDDFWAAMYGCQNPECANQYSRRFKDAQVVHSNIVGQSDTTMDNWNDFDMVFFYGHNNFIVPPHPHDSFQYHIYDHTANRWNQHTAPDFGALGWGQQTPYDYHYYHVTNATAQPGAVVYGYNAFTSLLLGYSDFKKNQWVTYRDVWYQPDKYYYSTGLGAPNLKWLILHGCQALIVANENGSQYDDRGYRALTPAWGALHMVLGHYRSFYMGELPDLNPFATDIKAGMAVQQAYFARDTVNNSSAMSAEDETGRICNWMYLNGKLYWICQILTANTMMAKDKWTSPQPNITPTWYYVKWVQDNL